MKRIKLLTFVAAISGTALMVTGLAGGVSPAEAASVVTGSLWPARSGGQSALVSQSEARAHARTLAQEQLDGTVGVPRQAAGRQVPARPVVVADMTEIQADFKAGGGTVTTATGQMNIGGGADVWVFVWQREHYSVPELSMDDATLRVVVAFEAATGRLRGAKVSIVNSRLAAD